MRENVGGAERALRGTIGPVLVAWGWLVLAPPGTRARRLRSC